MVPDIETGVDSDAPVGAGATWTSLSEESDCTAGPHDGAAVTRGDTPEDWASGDGTGACWTDKLDDEDACAASRGPSLAADLSCRDSVSNVDGCDGLMG